MIAGVAIGEQLAGSSSPADGVQEQDTPPDPVSGVETPAQTVAAPEPAAVGRALTVRAAETEVSDWPNPSVTTTS